jgi:hypothetical protein
MVAGCRMLAAVSLNYQPGFDAGEINEIRRDRELTAKPEAATISAQPMPRMPFRIGWNPAQSPSAFHDCAITPHRGPQKSAYSPITAR